LYPDIFDKAAALLHSLVLNRPFVDGNKRAGITAAGLFLQQNGRRLQATNEELASFTLQVAMGEVSVQEISGWLRRHSATQ
jgi:death on curing protein